MRIGNNELSLDQLDQLNLDDLDQASGGTLWGLTPYLHLGNSGIVVNPGRGNTVLLHPFSGHSALSSLFTGHFF